MNQASRNQLETLLGYQFQDKSLLKLALTHRSVGSTNNERLEFLGDSILSFIISTDLYKRFPKAREGDLSRMRSALVNGRTLAKIAKEFSLGDVIILGQGEMKSGGHRRESILADALEALIGAIYLDGGLESVKPALLNWFASRLDEISPSSSPKDSKTRLQELLQSRRQELPNYSLLTAEGEDHAQEFTVSCEIHGIKQRFKGVGSSRRKAEQAAAAAALSFLEKN